MARNFLKLAQDFCSLRTNKIRCPKNVADIGKQDIKAASEISYLSC